MRIIEVVLRYCTLQHEIHRQISSLVGRQECGNVRWSVAEKSGNQTTNLGVRSSNLFGRAKLRQIYDFCEQPHWTTMAEVRCRRRGGIRWPSAFASVRCSSAGNVVTASRSGYGLDEDARRSALDPRGSPPHPWCAAPTRLLAWHWSSRVKPARDNLRTPHANSDRHDYRSSRANSC